MSTKRTRDLADRLNPWIGTTPAIRDLAAELEVMGRAYSRIQERWCSEEMSEETETRLSKREEKIERAIADAVAELPLPWMGDDQGAGVWALRFDGDPRGPVVTLTPALTREEALSYSDGSRRETSREVWIG